MFNPINLSNDTREIYRAHLANGSYSKETYATNGDRLVDFINPDYNCPYRFYLRNMSNYLKWYAKTVDEAMEYLENGTIAYN